jgi:hypothetical protein
VQGVGLFAAPEQLQVSPLRRKSAPPVEMTNLGGLAKAWAIYSAQTTKFGWDAMKLSDHLEGAHHIVGFVFEYVAVVEIFAGVAVETDDDACNDAWRALDDILPA